jgi:uridylate kinase
MANVKYNRILLKISGEGLCRPGEFGIDAEELKRIGRELKTVVDLGVELAVVVGGGNIVRGTEIAAHGGIEEVTGHYMGMLGTVINALAVQDTLELIGLNTRVLSAVAVDRVCEKFIRRRAIRHLEKGRVVIFAGVREIPSSPPTPARRFVLRRSAPTCCSRPPRSMGFMTRTR